LQNDTRAACWSWSAQRHAVGLAISEMGLSHDLVFVSAMPLTRECCDFDATRIECYPWFSTHNGLLMMVELGDQMHARVVR
jgi:hypothetical protein